MPKLKLKGWQFMLMHEAMMEMYEKEMQRLYDLLCNLNGTPFEKSSIEIDKKRTEILSKYNDLCAFCKNKIRTYEERAEDGLCETDIQLLSKWDEQLAKHQDAIEQINEMTSRIYQFRNIASILKEKSNDKDFWRTYDDDPESDPPEMDPDEWDRRTDALVY